MYSQLVLKKKEAKESSDLKIPVCVWAVSIACPRQTNLKGRRGQSL
jgi:hypothetical protein